MQELRQIAGQEMHRRLVLDCSRPQLDKWGTTSEAVGASLERPQMGHSKRGRQDAPLGPAVAAQ